MNIGFQSIHPAPLYPAGLDATALSIYAWASKAADVVTFKQCLKSDLRKVQLGRCCYCRRMLPDSMATHIEHIVEKSVHPEFTFEIRNLALSCVTCNSRKNAHFLRLCGALSKRASKKATSKVAVRRCPTLSASIPTRSPFPVVPSAYRWVHPHFDQYSAHITVQRGWFFSAVSGKGFRTVRGLELNALAQLERRALEERMTARTGGLALIVGALGELNDNQARDVCIAVARELRRRRTQGRR